MMVTAMVGVVGHGEEEAGWDGDGNDTWKTKRNSTGWRFQSTGLSQCSLGAVLSLCLLPLMTQHQRPYQIPSPRHWAPQPPELWDINLFSLWISQVWYSAVAAQNGWDRNKRYHLLISSFHILFLLHNFRKKIVEVSHPTNAWLWVRLEFLLYFCFDSLPGSR
jgi:hypothetical protein